MRIISPATFAITSALFLGTFAPPVRADETESREYAVFVDGRPAGQCTITVVDQAKGAQYMKATVSVRFRKFFIEQSYSSQNEEWWRDGKLIGLKASAVENGKRTEVAGGMANEQLVVRGPNQNGPISIEAWPSSYWRTPAAKALNAKTPILDVDTGRELTGTVKVVGADKITVAGQPVDCQKLRVSGVPVAYDLWFDRAGRLVRQEFVDTGCRMIVQLTSVRR